MAVTVEELVVRAAIKDELSKGLVGIKEELKAVDDSVKKIGTNRGVRNLSGDVTGLGRQVQIADGHLRNLSRSADSLALTALRRTTIGVGALSAAMIGFGIKSAASFQQSRIAFGTLLDNAQRGNQLFADLQKFNLQTPFNLGEISQATQTLLQFGFTGDNVMQTLKAISDVSATTSNPGENLGRIALAIGQISSAGVLRAQDLNQLVQSGFPAYQLLAQVSGKTMMQIRKDMESGLDIPSSKFIEAMNAGQGVMAKFAGGAQAQAKTLGGIFSNLHDTVMVRLATAFQPLADSLATRMPLITTEIGAFIDKSAPALSKLMVSLLDATTTLLPVFGDQFSAMLLQLVPIMPDLVHAFVTFVGLLPDLVHLLGTLITFAAPILRLVDSLAQMHGVAEGLLAVLLGYRVLSGVAGAVIKFAGALDVLTASEAANAGVGGIGGKGGLGKAIGVGAGLIGGGALVAQGVHGKQSTTGDLETIGGTTVIGGTIGSVVPVLGTAVGAGLGAAAGAGIVAARRFSGQSHATAAPLEGSPVTPGYHSQVTMAPGAVVVNNPASNVDVAVAVQQGIDAHERSKARRAGQTFGRPAPA